MCDLFQCRFAYLDLDASGSVITTCHMHNIDLDPTDCDCCLFKDCQHCRNSSGSCRDKAYNYFKEVYCGSFNKTSSV